MSIKMKIKVTKEILKKSMWCHPNQGNCFVGTSCAIALSVIDIFPDGYVGENSIFPFWGENNLEIKLPKEPIVFIESFDALVQNPIERLKLPELEFEIEIPDSVISQIGNGNIDEVKTIIQNSETLELV